MNWEKFLEALEYDDLLSLQRYLREKIDEIEKLEYGI